MLDVFLDFFFTSKNNPLLVEIKTMLHLLGNGYAVMNVVLFIHEFIHIFFNILCLNGDFKAVSRNF